MKTPIAPAALFVTLFAFLMVLFGTPAGATSTLMSSPVPQSASAHGDLPGPGAPSVHAVRDLSAWQQFQTEQRLTWAAPIDFARDMVVAVFLGTRNTTGYTVQIANVRATDAVTEVIYTEIPPQALQTVNETLTNPYVLSVIPQSALPVVFSSGHFKATQIPYGEYTRLIRQISEMSYQLDDVRRKNAMSEGRVRDLNSLITRTAPPPSPPSSPPPSVR